MEVDALQNGILLLLPYSPRHISKPTRTNTEGHTHVPMPRFIRPRRLNDRGFLLETHDRTGLTPSTEKALSTN